MIFKWRFIRCDQHMWRYITPAFEKDYRIVVFDYVGSGKSDARAYSGGRYNQLNGYVDDLLEICYALTLEGAIFVGHSVSCMIGLLAANRNPKLFSKMIFIGPSPRYLAGELAESFCSTDPVMARKFAEVTFLSDNRADLADLHVPVLLMQCC